MAACRASCHRKDDARFAGKNARRGRCRGARDRDCVHGQSQCRQRHAHHHRQLLGEHRPSGYGVQTKSHNAVAAAVRQGRADWGVAIETVAHQLRARLHPAAGRALRFHRAPHAPRATRRASVLRAAARPCDPPGAPCARIRRIVITGSPIVPPGRVPRARAGAGSRRDSTTRSIFPPPRAMAATRAERARADRG